VRGEHELGGVVRGTWAGASAERGARELGVVRGTWAGASAERGARELGGVVRATPGERDA
jgi:hypothetical protein